MADALVFFRVCVTPAARKSEVLKLRWPDLRLEDSLALLGKSKNDEPRALPLVIDMVTALGAANKIRPPVGDYVSFDPKQPAVLV